MGIVSVIVVCVLIISLIMATLKKLYNFFFGSRLSSNIPSPPAYPFLRHVPYFLHATDYDKKMQKWEETYKKDGLFMFDVLLGPERVCILREDFIKQVLVTKCTKYGRPKVLQSVFPKMEKGVFMVNGKEHAWQRKMLNPSFSFSSLLSFVEIFDANTNNLIKYWKDKAESSFSGVAEADIHRDLSKLALDTIGETAFGYNFNTLISGENKVSQAVELILSGKMSVVSRVLRKYIPFYDMIPFQENVQLKEAAEVMNDFVNEIIKKKREALKSGVDPNGVVSKDLLGKMILLQDEETGKRLSDEVIEAQVHTFMVAGHETTSVCLTWTLYLLAKHPDVQEKARKEATSILAGTDVFQGEHLEGLKYVTAVIKESLRIYPPAAINMREALQDDQLGEYSIPKGTYILIPVCAIHHIEEFWPNHEKFMPERFLAEGTKQPEMGNYKFIPFSNGPRNCIGWRFSMMEMKVAIAKLLTTFKFELDPRQEEMHTNMELTLKPHPKPILRVSPIDE
ncbi:cytochrome P450 4F4-like [Rhopilema esculentum]|uniref:cytochrome P450 4F4-like n=1 Tax=Rhopilema esculentum TaxID=499914 RepID=UPI0031D6EA62|eukprot:gene12263-2905_t